MASDDLLRRRLVLLAASVLGVAVAGGQSPRDLGLRLFYQVAYEDGTIRDVSSVPRTEQGIRMVTRISRYQPGAKARRLLATGPVPLTLPARGWTIKTDLVWKQGAWVAPPVVETLRRHRAGRASAVTQPAVESAAVRKLIEDELKRHRARLDKLGAAVAQVERDLRATEDPRRRENLQTVLSSMRQEQEKIAQSVREYEQLLGTLGGDGSIIRPPVGTTGGDNPPPATQPSFGVAKPLVETEILPYRAQVWRLPSAQGLRRVTVSMAHPEAGPFGAFYYVAYADEDRDGRPDRLIGRSPLIEASAPGQWTRWSFSTDADAVFVGNTWPDPDTSVYYAPRGAAPWRGGLGEVYVSGSFGLVPRWRCPWGDYLTNLRVYVGRQNPP